MTTYKYDEAVMAKFCLALDAYNKDIVAADNLISRAFLIKSKALADLMDEWHVKFKAEDKT